MLDPHAALKIGTSYFVDFPARNGEVAWNNDKEKRWCSGSPQHSRGNFIDATGFIDIQRDKGLIKISERDSNGI